MMPTLHARLTTLKARDVMTRRPVTLCETQSIASAVSTLERHEITGAPVVDQAGELVGMLSLWDIVRVKPASTAPENPTETPEGRVKAIDSAKSTRDAMVRDRMTRSVGTIADDQPLADIARMLCERHWHRVPVVGQDGRLVGIVSTMDVLAALVNAVEESS